MRTPLDPEIADRTVTEWVLRQRARRQPAQPSPEPILTHMWPPPASR